jgi:hypothetical protein
MGRKKKTEMSAAEDRKHAIRKMNLVHGQIRNSFSLERINKFKRNTHVTTNQAMR